MFDHGRLERGQTVLIHAAAGGVGTFAVQLAHWKGARVLGTASADHADYIRSLGADEVIDYRSTPFESVVRDVDLVLDLVGGETQKRSFAVLKPGGRLVSALQPPSEDEATRHKVHSVVFHMQPSTKGLAMLSELLDAGTIRTVVTNTFPLAKAADALAGDHVGLHAGQDRARGPCVTRVGRGGLIRIREGLSCVAKLK